MLEHLAHKTILEFDMTQGAAGVTLRILCSNGMHGAMAELGPQFERASGHKLDFTFDTGVGFNERIARGERGDLAIITVPILQKLAGEGVTHAARALARSGAGLGVRTGAAKPDIGSVDSFKRALLAAKSITFTRQGASGIYFAGLIERMGIAAEIRAKATTPDGGLVGEIVVAGKAELAVQQIPELKAVAGIDVVGPFPAEVQVYTDMAAATFCNAPHAAAAQALLDFLDSPQARKVYIDKGMEAV
jgi:molybdate transport system substrate-binding protein